MRELLNPLHERRRQRRHQISTRHYSYQSSTRHNCTPSTITTTTVRVHERTIRIASRRAFGLTEYMHACALDCVEGVSAARWRREDRGDLQEEEVVVEGPLCLWTHLEEVRVVMAAAAVGALPDLPGGGGGGTGGGEGAAPGQLGGCGDEGAGDAIDGAVVDHLVVCARLVLQGAEGVQEGTLPPTVLGHAWGGCGWSIGRRSCICACSIRPDWKRVR
jgi:hypothetical protein